MTSIVHEDPLEISLSFSDCKGDKSIGTKIDVKFDAAFEDVLKRVHKGMGCDEIRQKPTITWKLVPSKRGARAYGFNADMWKDLKKTFRATYLAAKTDLDLDGIYIELFVDQYVSSFYNNIYF